MNGITQRGGREAVPGAGRAGGGLQRVEHDDAPIVRKKIQKVQAAHRTLFDNIKSPYRSDFGPEIRGQADAYGIVRKYRVPHAEQQSSHCSKRR